MWNTSRGSQAAFGQKTCLWICPGGGHWGRTVPLAWWRQSLFACRVGPGNEVMKVRDGRSRLLIWGVCWWRKHEKWGGSEILETYIGEKSRPKDRQGQWTRRDLRFGEGCPTRRACCRVWSHWAFVVSNQCHISLNCSPWALLCPMTARYSLLFSQFLLFISYETLHSTRKNNGKRELIFIKSSLDLMLPATLWGSKTLILQIWKLSLEKFYNFPKSHRKKVRLALNPGLSKYKACALFTLIILSFVIA